jgi:hypothetical protein
MDTINVPRTISDAVSVESHIDDVFFDKTDGNLQGLKTETPKTSLVDSSQTPQQSSQDNLRLIS